MNKRKYNLDLMDKNQYLECQLFSYRDIIKNDLQTLEDLTNTLERDDSNATDKCYYDNQKYSADNPAYSTSADDYTTPNGTVVRPHFGDNERLQQNTVDEMSRSRQSLKVSSRSLCRQSSKSQPSLSKTDKILQRQSSESQKSSTSLHRQSSNYSESKPDVVRCTRTANAFNERNIFRFETDISKPNELSRKRFHSFGDELDLEESDVLAKPNGRAKSEDAILDLKDSSFETNKSRVENGIWMTNMNPDHHLTDNDKLWMTKNTPEDNSVKKYERRDGWRLSLDHFSPKRQGSKRKAKHVSKPIRSYYKSQDKLIQTFEGIRYEIEDDKIDMNELRRKVSLYAKITFFANLVLLVIKVVAVIMSGSVSLISSLVDSAVDLISGVVIWLTTRLVKRTDLYRYPQGRRKLEPIAVVILSVIMAVASLHLIEETIEKTVHLATGDSEPPTMEWITVGISCTTVVVKLVLFLICRTVPHHTIQALAQDHRNDILSNSAAIIFGYIGSKEMQAQTNNSTPGLIYLDPTGAILICIYISISWCYTGWGQIKMLIGHTAKPDFLSKITWFTFDHHEKIEKINSVRAFHFGNNFLVEVEILLPVDMTVQEARDIAEPLQQKLERLGEVERAFVHINCQTDAQKRNKLA